MRGTDFFKELAREIIPLGFRCFLYDHDNSNWLSVITPNGSWLEVFHGDYSGYNITYQYVPSRDFGSGCRCNTDALYEINSEILLDAERYGKGYSSRKVRVTGVKKPKHYENGFDALMNSYFGSKGMYEEIYD